MTSASPIGSRGIGRGVAWLLAAGLAACGGGETTSNRDVTPAPPDATGELPSDGTTSDLAADDADVASPEDAGSEGSSPDAPVGDGAGDGVGDGAGDAADVPPDAPPPEGAFGAPCESNEECFSGFCVTSREGRVCTQTCSESCPDGWACRESGGADPTFICLPRFVHLCDPCSSNGDCVRSNSDAAHRCVDRGSEGNFCGTVCSGDGDCPDGYACETVVGVEGASTEQCVPTEGVCTCSPLAIEQGLETTCTPAAPNACQGTRRCAEEGLTDCEAELCELPKVAEYTCDGGTCGIGTCEEGFSSCDGADATGCETDVQTSTAHCGGCGQACEPPHVAEPVCESGSCGIGACNEGRANCDGEVGNGCEIDLTSDVSNCGACGEMCEVPQGEPACVDGACAIASCAEGRASCDEQVETGCETDVTQSLEHCGSCDDACNTTHVAEPACDGGSCEIEACEEGWRSCDGSPSTGCEQEILSSLQHCGGCDEVCDPPHATAECADGSCTIAACDEGHYDLDGQVGNGCEYACDGDPSVTDVPDDSFTDKNCDGIHGTLDAAYFVSPDGSDSNPGTREAPFRTIQHGIDQAAGDAQRWQVLVAAGEYNTTVTLGDGVSLFGGYGTESWTRSPDKTTTIASPEPIGLRVDGYASEGYVDGVEVVAANASDSGRSSRAVSLQNVGGDLELRHSTLRAGEGASGDDGASGSDGGSGSSGEAGEDGRVDGGDSDGGNGGGSPCGRNGGDGGTSPEAGDGFGGSSGSGGGGSGGSGGDIGDGIAFVCENCCAPGQNGSGASSGSNGSDGNDGSLPSNQARGTLSGSAWQALGGEAGSDGSHGGGGGGGGGGAGLPEGSICSSHSGGGGGGGGGAGCGGSAGEGGSGGGGSFGIVAIDAAGATLKDLTIVTATGGDGGDGGDGGAGGNGASGASGGSNTSRTVDFGTYNSGVGGDGGSGGDGGDAGGGAGGAGGMSVGILVSGNAPSRSNNDVQLGDAGDGGNGGANGGSGSAPDGEDGIRTELYTY